MGLLVGIILVGLLIYVVREAAMLKSSAADLKAELQEFKTRSFDALIRAKLEPFERATQEREKLLQQKEDELSRQRQEALRQITAIREGFGEVRTKMGELAGLQGKVGELNDLLKPQQLRGELGEVIVRNLLADKLPKQYEEDYTFSDGKKVEFAIRLGEKLIPVDSKLQIEDYKRLREADERQRPALRTEFKRTVRQKIDEVKHYIRPQEGTYNFALMVIPSEAVFYELVASKDFTEDGGLYEYAQTSNVFLTSPLTFWAYLVTIAQGLKGLEIEHRAEEVLASLQTLAGQVRRFAQEEFRKVGVHLRNANSQYDQAEKAFKDVEQTLTNVERIGGAHQPPEEAIP
ncbi:MAG: DNA recombination protein RmuC [Candidatus Omnitrophica bacterium]|nr:DNA recombination protein RmuC [Candidatus Omnitrophota bacterium]